MNTSREWVGTVGDIESGETGYVNQKDLKPASGIDGLTIDTNARAQSDADTTYKVPLKRYDNGNLRANTGTEIKPVEEICTVSIDKVLNITEHL